MIEHKFENSRLGFTTYIKTALLFGVACGVLYSPVAFYEFYSERDVLLAAVSILLAPLAAGLCNGFFAVITYPIYLVITKAIKGHSIEHVAIKNS